MRYDVNSVYLRFSFNPVEDIANGEAQVGQHAGTGTAGRSKSRGAKLGAGAVTGPQDGTEAILLKSNIYPMPIRQTIIAGYIQSIDKRITLVSLQKFSLP